MEPRPEHTCIVCGSTESPDPVGLCPTCAEEVRVELAIGFRRLRQYLAAWAAFDEWQRDEGTEAA